MPAGVEVSVRFCNHPKEPGSLTEECPDCRSHLVQVRSFPCLLLLKDRTKPCLIIAPKACFSLHVLAPVSSEVVFRSAAEAFHAAKSSEGWAVSSQQCLFPGHCGCSFRRGQSKACGSWEGEWVPFSGLSRCQLLTQAWGPWHTSRVPPTHLRLVLTTSVVRSWGNGHHSLALDPDVSSVLLTL